MRTGLEDISFLSRNWLEEIRLDWNEVAKINGLRAMKEKVEEDLDRLERIGVISKVETSEWATPTVPVRKPNGSVRLCGDN